MQAVTFFFHFVPSSVLHLLLLTTNFVTYILTYSLPPITYLLTFIPHTSLPLSPFISESSILVCKSLIVSLLCLAFLFSSFPVHWSVLPFCIAVAIFFTLLFVKNSCVIKEMEISFRRTPSGNHTRVSTNRRSRNLPFCPRRQLCIGLLLDGSRILCNGVVCQYRTESGIRFHVENGNVFSAIDPMAAKTNMTSFEVQNTQ